MRTSRPFSETLNEVLKDPEQAALYLETCLEEGDMDLFTVALKDIANAHGGMNHLSEITCLNSEELYHTLSESRISPMETLYKVLRTMGLLV